MATNVDSAAVDRRSDSYPMSVPQASERSLNQSNDTGMREHAQHALEASLTIGCGPDMYDEDGDCGTY